MAPHELAEIIRKSTHSVFSTMLGTELAPLEALDDPKPFMASEVIGFIGLAGDIAPGQRDRQGHGLDRGAAGEAGGFQACE